MWAQWARRSFRATPLAHFRWGASPVIREIRLSRLSMRWTLSQDRRIQRAPKRRNCRIFTQIRAEKSNAGKQLDGRTIRWSVWQKLYIINNSGVESLAIFTPDFFIKNIAKCIKMWYNEYIEREVKNLEEIKEEAWKKCSALLCGVNCCVGNSYCIDSTKELKGRLKNGGNYRSISARRSCWNQS
jgi:hypothetical protein